MKYLKKMRSILIFPTEYFCGRMWGRVLEVFLGSMDASYVKIFAAKKIYVNAFA